MRKTKMRRKNVLVLFMLLLFSMSAFAQQRTIKGTVTDANNEAIIGASVITKDGKSGVVTNLDGQFTISISTNEKILIVKSVGKQMQEVAITGNTLNVTLQDDQKALDEVVVIGYGTVKKKDLTGSVASVKGESLSKIPVSNVAEAMTGKLAGVRLTTTDGSPDAEVLIRVRGGGSITQDNSPLYIVDGFPTNNINDIPANDIEDITVLRDASTTAIYGSRGANGVILVTTKKAEGGKTRINYNSFFQTKSIAKRLEAMNTYDYVMSNYEYALLKGSTSTFFEAFGVYDDFDLYKSIKPIDWQGDMFGASVLSQQHNLSINGGNDKTNFTLSGNYDYNGGLMVNNDYSRFAFQLKFNHQISKNLKFGINARVNDQVVNGSGTQGGLYKIRTSQAITSVATKGLSDFIDIDTSTMTDEEYQEYLENSLSLSEQAQRYWRRTNNRGFNFNASLDWTILNGLVAHGEAGYGYGFNETKNWWGATTTNASFVGGLPLAEWTKANTSNWREAVTLTYNFKVNEDHNFTVMTGEEILTGMGNSNYMYGTKYSKAYTPEKIFANFGLANGVISLKSAVSADDNMASFFGRANYSYKERYLFTLTARNDGSSKFDIGQKWSFFPSAAAAWRIVEEPFMKPSEKWLSNLKLRLSYGEAGNNRIGNLLYKLTYALNSGSKRYGVGETSNNDYSPASSFLSNPNLHWEKTVTRNLGLDFGFFKERINGTIDLYSNLGLDVLIPHTITAPGYTNVWENTAKTQNNGAELTINANIARRKNFTFDANFNIGFNKSKILALSQGVQAMSFPSGWASTDNKNQEDYIVKVGEPIGQIYGWICDGYYTTADFSSYDVAKKAYILNEGVASTGLLGGAIGIRPGTMKLRDVSGPNGVPDGIVDSNDRVVIGDTNPLFQGGFGFSTSIYGFDLAANFTYSYGNDVYNANKIASTQQYRSGNYPNMLAIMSQSNSYSYMNPETGQLMTSLEELAAWNEGANVKEYWSPYSIGSAVVVPTDWAMEDASFIRLQSVTLGYTIPKKCFKKLKINNLRIYTTATNLFVLTNYSGYDPEVSSYARNSTYSTLTPGIDYSSYPKSRGFTFGINVSL